MGVPRHRGCGGLLVEDKRKEPVIVGEDNCSPGTYWPIICRKCGKEIEGNPEIELSEEEEEE